MMTTDLQSTLDTYNRDGIVVFDGLLDATEVAALRSDGEAIKARFHDKYGATSPIKTRGGWRLDIPPVNLVRSNGAHLARAVGRAMAHPLIQQACHAILGPHWSTTALVFDYREPTTDPLPPEDFKSGYPPAYYWHVDHGMPGKLDPSIFTLRFQIYLNDTDFQRGALAYGRGSHRLVKHMRQQISALSAAQATMPVIDTHQSLTAARDYLTAHGHPLEPAFEDIYASFIETAPSYKHASADSACEGKAGTVLMFDDTGMHRGNFVQTDHRYVCRCLCMPTGLKSVLKDWVSIKNTLARNYYKATLNEPFRALM
ncbi:MAG: phytanoyl-CoA dioxygenase family protein [Rhodospirillales bacterium]